MRQKYKDNPELYKDPIDWTPKKEKEKQRKNQEKNAKQNKSNKKSSKQTSNKGKTKNKGFRGAQGGSGDSSKFDINKNKNLTSNKKNIPDHIKKKRKRG